MSVTGISFGLYVRVSTEDQARGYAGRSLDELAADPTFPQSVTNQLTAGRALIAQAEGHLYREYIDCERYRDGAGRMVEPSAKRPDRPAWRQMLADADAGHIRGLVAQDNTRLYGDYRPWVDLVECVERNRLTVLLVTDTWNADTSIMNAWARRQWYREHAYRTARGRDARARNGLSRTGVPNWYRALRDDRGRTVGYELREEYREFLDRLRDLYLDGVAYAEIARQLGRNPATGTRLDGTIIRKVINCEFNFGVIATPQGQYPGRHVPAWDAASLSAMRAEQARRASQVKAPGPRRNAGLFAGLLRCGVCGHTMTSTSGHATGKLYVHYYCHGAQRKGLHPRNSIGEVTLIQQLKMQFAQVTDETFDQLLRTLALPPASSVAALGRRVGELEAELATLAADLERVSATTRPLIAAQVASLTAELEQARAQLAAAGTDQTPDPAVVREWLTMVRQPELWQRPRAELRARLHRFIPALYVLGGELVPPPQVPE